MDTISKKIHQLFCFKNKQLVYFYDYIYNYIEPNENTREPLESIDYDKKIICYTADYLTPYTEPKDSENIVCYDNQDNILWKVHGEVVRHFENESFAGIGYHREQNALGGTTYSGEAHRIDIETGYATYYGFVK